MVSEWKELSIGDVCTIRRGASPRPIKNFISDSGIPWVKIADATASDSRYITSTKEFIIEEGRTKSVEVEIGDLILSNSATPGIPKIMKINACIHDGWLLLRNFKGVIKEYLYYLLLKEKDNILGYANGTVFQNLKTDILRDYKIKIPPLSEQQKIISILSAFDDKIELNNEMNKTLEEIAQAIFKHWFIDFEFPNENGEPYKSSGGEFVDSELGPIPKGWRINTIRDICKNNTAITGKTPPTRVKENYGDYMMFITIPDMHGNVFVINTQKKLSRIGANSQKNKTLPPLSICVSCIATPGLVCLTSEPSQTNQQINSIVCKENISPYYIFSLMKNYRTHIINLGSGGTATLNLNKRDFEKIKIIIPETNIMKKYESKTKHLFDRILLNQKENAILSQLRDTLLPKLISGEIRVV